MLSFMNFFNQSIFLFPDQLIQINITFNFHKAPSIPKTGALAPDVGIYYTQYSV